MYGGLAAQGHVVLGLQPAAEKLNKQQWGNGQIWLGALLEVKEGDSFILYYQRPQGHMWLGNKLITTDQWVPGSAHSGLVQGL